MDESNKQLNTRKKKNKNTAGRLFIISAPSGAGKTTLCRAILKKFTGIAYSISYTTRAPRKGEKDGIDYLFLDKNDFQEKIKAGKMAEWAEVHGNFYGTSSEFIKKKTKSGIDVLLDIDIQGAKEILEKYPKSISIFIMPPSNSELENRLRKRATDTEEVIKKRLIIAKKEMGKKEIYDYIVINDKLEEAIEKLSSIITINSKD